jgi:hypothetical protein
MSEKGEKQKMRQPTDKTYSTPARRGDAKTAKTLDRGLCVESYIAHCFHSKVDLRFYSHKRFATKSVSLESIL